MWCFSGDRWGSIDSIAMWVHLQKLTFPNFQGTFSTFDHGFRVALWRLGGIFAKGTTRFRGSKNVILNLKSEDITKTSKTP